MLSTLICFAQQQSLITGSVFTNDYLPAEGANIVLLSATDSAFITGTAANKNGNFQLKEIPKGLYYVQVSMLGYQKNSCKNRYRSKYIITHVKCIGNKRRTVYFFSYCKFISV